MRQLRREWTDADDELLKQLMTQNLTWTEISRRMDRARQVIARKLRGGYVGVERAQHRVVIKADFQIEIPDHVLSDRDRRLNLAPRDLTAAFCGDPLPGFSALERRHG